MCESKIVSQGKTIFEDVVKLRVEGEKLLVFDILGEAKEIKGKILEVDLLAHKIVVEVFE
ncbi:MAG: CooT family nickel-binding protein [Archaeoglobaceae archaeon]